MHNIELAVAHWPFVSGLYLARRRGGGAAGSGFQKCCDKVIVKPMRENTDYMYCILTRVVMDHGASAAGAVLLSHRIHFMDITSSSRCKRPAWTCYCPNPNPT